MIMFISEGKLSDLSNCCITLVNVQNDSVLSFGCSDNVRNECVHSLIEVFIISFMKSIQLLCGCYVCFLA